MRWKNLFVKYAHTLVRTKSKREFLSLRIVDFSLVQGSQGISDMQDASLAKAFGSRVL